MSASHGSPKSLCTSSKLPQSALPSASAPISEDIEQRPSLAVVQLESDVQQIGVLWLECIRDEAATIVTKDRQRSPAEEGNGLAQAQDLRLISWSSALSMYAKLRQALPTMPNCSPESAKMASSRPACLVFCIVADPGGQPAWPEFTVRPRLR